MNHPGERGREERAARRRRFFEGNATHSWRVCPTEDAFQCRNCPAKVTGYVVLMEPEMKLEACP